MFRVELEFSYNLTEKKLDAICSGRMKCIQKLPGKRIYEDNDNMTLSDIGVFLEALSDNDNIRKNLTKATGNFDGEVADLIKDYIRCEE